MVHRWVLAFGALSWALAPETAGIRWYLPGNTVVTPLERGGLAEAESCLVAHRLALGCAMLHAMVCALVAVWTNTFLLCLSVAVPAVLFPAYITRRYPHALLSRLSMAGGFMALTALLIEQTGGDEEAHFSFFVMMPILVVYCDWRPLVFALVLIIAHHFCFTILQESGLGFYVWNDNRNAWGHLAIHGAVGTVQTGALCYLALTLCDRYRLARENKQLGQQVRTMSAKVNLDLLTGLSNRFYLDAWLAQFAECAKRGSETMILCILDLDYFKSINDRFGHSVGDDALRAVGAIVQNVVSAGDVAVRYGGEEFVLILRKRAPDDALAFAERLRQKIAVQTLLGAGGTCFVTASFGLAQWQISEDFHDVFRRADRALYQAKALGRNRVVFAGGPCVPDPDSPEHRSVYRAPVVKSPQQTLIVST